VRDIEEESDEAAESELTAPDTAEQDLLLDPVTLHDTFQDRALGDSGPHWEIIDELDVRQEPAATLDSDSLSGHEQPAAPPAIDDAVPPAPDVVAAPVASEPSPMTGFSALDDDFVFPDGTPSTPSSPALSQENLENIASARESLELDWQERSAPRTRSAWWTVAAILLVMTLLLQFVYFQWAALEQNPTLRPWLQRLCQTLPCTLQPMVDIRSIGSDNLLVRSHTEIANALTVTLVFRNASDFDLALPALNLHFMNADNDVIAARQFSPPEYLPAALADLQVLPAGAPVQVSFDIIDPGIEAVNYEVSFSPFTAR